MLNVSRLDLADAMRLIEGAVAHAADIGVPMCVSVVDESGHTIAFQRMDDAKVLSVRLSDDKAYTAAVSRRGTHEYNEICVPGNLVFGIHTAAEGRFSTVGGGLPVRSDGESVLGAIGCSGGTPEQDMDCARVGIAYWKARTDNDVS